VTVKVKKLPVVFHRSPVTYYRLISSLGKIPQADIWESMQETLRRVNSV
jgi:hypothetical protein